MCMLGWNSISNFEVRLVDSSHPKFLADSLNSIALCSRTTSQKLTLRSGVTKFNEVASGMYQTIQVPTEHSMGWLG